MRREMERKRDLARLSCGKALMKAWQALLCPSNTFLCLWIPEREGELNQSVYIAGTFLLTLGSDKDFLLMQI